MPLRRVLSFFIASFIAILFVGCGSSSGTNNYPTFQTFQNADAPVRLSFVTLPQRAANSTFSLSVAVVDHNGKVVTNDTRAITISLVNPNGATLSGTTTKNAVGGIATFNDLSIDKTGQYAFLATADGLISAQTADQQLTITSATPGQISFLVQPPAPPASGTAPNATNSVTKNMNFPNTIQVEVRDANGNLVTTASTVQIVVANDPTGNTTLSGNSAVTVNGVASFPDLQVETGGGITVLAAATSSSNVAVSNPFFVNGELYAFLGSNLAGAVLRQQVFPTAGAAQPVAVLTPAYTTIRGVATLKHGTFAEGRILTVADQAMGNTQILTLNADTGAIVNAVDITVSGNPNAAMQVTGLTVNPADSKVYAYITGPVTNGLYTIDATSGVATFVGATGLANTGEGLAVESFVENKFLYTGGGATANGLSSLSLTAGTGTAITTTNPTQLFTSLAINPFNTELFGVDSGTNIVTINKTSGATTSFVPASGASFISFFSLQN